MAYQALILDVDGTLLDSNDSHARAWVAALKDEGYDFSFEEVRPLIGMGGDQVVPRLTDVQPDTPEYERLSKGWQQHFENDELGKVRPQPGAKALVEALLARGLRLIVGSSGEDEIVEKLLKIADLNELLPDRTHSEEIKASKPEPDIVKVALGKLGLQPEQVLMVGDTPFDIEAARRSGVGTVALRCGGDDRFEGAVAVFDSPADWKDKLDQAPLGSAQN